jgi:transcriptional regulator with GAF, ATPase, and Fis domain
MTADTSDRLRLLYDLSRRLATFNDLDDVLRQATGALRELFDADGSAVLILDDDTPATLSLEALDGLEAIDFAPSAEDEAMARDTVAHRPALPPMAVPPERLSERQVRIAA